MVNLIREYEVEKYLYQVEKFSKIQRVLLPIVSVIQEYFASLFYKVFKVPTGKSM